MLVLDAVCKTLPPPGRRRLFDGVAFTARAGEIVALVGESGCGKTTLLNCIAGLEQPDSGNIRLGEHDIAALSAGDAARLRRRDFGFIFQAFHILPHLRLADNVALPLWLNDVPAADAAAQARTMLNAVGLGDRTEAWPRELSGGELQRVAIARALIHRPRLVLADEPTGSLDPDNAERVLALLFAQVHQAGAIGLLATHSAAVAARADRVLRLTSAGRVEAA
jgi:putative ABC transport system ATP-binding protein